MLLPPLAGLVFPVNFRCPMANYQALYMICYENVMVLKPNL